MSRKMFKIVSILVLFSMLVVPVSAQPTSTSISQATAKTDGSDSKLQLEAVDPSQVTQVGNPNSVVKGEIKGASGEARYIIQLADPALAGYRGGINGLEATSPTITGASKLDVKSPSSQAYLSYLASQHTQVLNAISTAFGRQVDVVFQYQYAFNGFALVLTPVEAAEVAKMPGVNNVWREQIAEIETDAGPPWIGAAGIWDGTSTGGLPGTKGEGIIAGILDTGINHDHPSFADVGDDGYDHTNPWGSDTYVGWCETDDPSFCNDKLIGAWDFVYDIAPTPPNYLEYPSPEDENEHGSHTASTVAGNVVTATLIAPTLEYSSTISGVAPHANLIAYDICYTRVSDNGGLCPDTASVMAADQALADGVDVINFSIGGGDDPYNDPVELAFLSLFEAGVFVSASAGNEGPYPATLGHQSPWVSTTAAATHNRAFFNFLADMSGGDTTPPDDIQGVGFTDGYGPEDIVYAGAYGDPLCPLGAFDPGTFTGQIVVCDRGGGIARVEKAQSAANGGAGGFVLANDSASGNSLVGDAYVIPGVHITYNDGVALKAWLASGEGHTATITGIVKDLDPANGDVLASFSSRGPNTALDIVKPNTTAPGVNIWAAINTPDPENPGLPEYGFLSGTSMSSPHNAGAAALLIALHPDWSVAEVMSALMSTADTTVLKEDGVTPAGYFDMGSGRDELLYAGQTGFVLDESSANMEAADPATGGDPRTLNLPSMADSKCLKSCSWTRTITSVLDYTVSWQVETNSADGVVITVAPDNFVLSAGGSQELTITADVNGLPTGDWLFGEVMFSQAPDQAINQVPDIHFPLAVVPSTGIFPDLVEINTRRNAGSQLEADLQAVEITDLTVESFGLTQATLTNEELSQDPTNDNAFDNLNDGTTFYITTTVPADAKRLVAEITYSEAPDLDLYVGTGITPSLGTTVCTSATGIALEYCELTDPPEGMYWILVQNWKESGSPPDLVTLASAVVPSEDAGNLTIDGPTSWPALTPFDIRVYWDTPEMMAGDRWYGAFSLGSNPGNPGDIATIPVNIIREEDDVTKTASAETVMPGDVVTYTITVQPNVFSEDLNYTITDTIPEGMTYVPASASASEGTVNVVGDTVSWTGSMRLPYYTYNIATSLTNPACSMPYANSGDYVHLEAYNINPIAGISGDTKWYYVDFAGGELNLFNEYSGEYLNFTDDGFTFLDPSTPGGEPWTNYPIPTSSNPNNLMAIFWRDMVIVYDAVAKNGVSLADVTDDNENPVGYIIEYDGVQDYPAGPSQYSYDFEMFGYYDPQPNDYEYIFAYDELTGNTITGTVGLENAGGTFGVQYGYNNLVLQDGMAICFDLVQVLGTPVTITYQVTVDGGVIDGSEFTNSAVHNTDNLGSLPAVASVTILYTPLYTYLPLVMRASSTH
jgi:uncharacterized repeat protein (TIGR01451 family)